MSTRPRSLSHSDYCIRLVRDHDYDRYLCTLFVPRYLREAWCALFAFNHEIAAISEVVSEEMIGFMRFAWWREALDEIYAGGPVRNHPVVQALAEAISSCHLPRAPFDAMLAAREELLGVEDSMRPVQWEVYCKATSSSLMTLCASAAALGPLTALESLGVVWAAIGMARVSRQKKDEAQAQLFITLAESHWDNACSGLQELFHPFKSVAEFYLKRLKKGKSMGKETRLALVASLLWQQFFKRLF